jgi:hypothetical protein
MLQKYNIATGIIDVPEDQCAKFGSKSLEEICNIAGYYDNTIKNELYNARPDKYSVCTQNITAVEDSRQTFITDSSSIPSIQSLIRDLIDIMDSNDEGAKIAIAQNLMVLKESVRRKQQLEREYNNCENDFKTAESQGEKKQAGGANSYNNVAVVEKKAFIIKLRWNYYYFINNLQRGGVVMKKYLKISLLIFIILSILFIFCDDVFSQAKSSKKMNRLDELRKETTIRGRPFIQSYTIEGASAHIQLNPSLWNSMSSSEQRQICDMLAATDVWQKMNLLNAYLYVNKTNIGRIGPALTGGFKFKPALKSLE